MNQLKKIFCFCYILFLFGCTTSTQQALNQAQSQGFREQAYPIESSFTLTTYERLQGPAKNIHVYIEGDGHSWQNKYKLSSNPTPKHPLALKLALADPHSHVVYLARPCQYTPLAKDLKCHPKYWSSHRFSPEVIEAMDTVLNNIKQRTHNTSFTLIGYSGGGGLAVLIAAQRKDIKELITVAGDLDHERLNQYHHVTSLSHSLNPIDVASQLKQLPQKHLSGEKDKVVPPWVAKQFAQAVNNPQTVRVQVLPNVSHHEGWEEQWKFVMPAEAGIQDL